MISGLIKVAPGTFHTMLINSEDGSVWSTGVNSDTQRQSFVLVMGRGATAAAAGNYYSIIVKEDNGVWTTGKDSKGQLSFFAGSTVSRSTFSFVQSIPGANVVAAGKAIRVLCVFKHKCDVWKKIKA